MPRFFNTAGPCFPEDHYMIDPLTRIDLPDVEALIDQKRYFVLHAPRQTGKTTTLLALMHHLNAGGKYRCLYANIETAQTTRNDVDRGMNAICYAIAQSASIYLEDDTLEAWYHQPGTGKPAESRLISDSSMCLETTRSS